MRKIKKGYKDGGLSEVGQKSLQKIQVANATAKTVPSLSVPFKCREFYSDLLFSFHTGVCYNIYGWDTGTMKDWTGDYLISTYAQTAEVVLERLAILNKQLEGTVPPIEMEELDMEGSLNFLGDESSGFLVTIPKWWNETLVRGSVLTALLRTISYPNPLDIDIEQSYAEACVTQMYKNSFPKLDAYSDSLWNTIFFPALNLEYKNCLGVDDKTFKLSKEFEGGINRYTLHGNTGIYTMWNALFQYVSRPDPIKNFEENTNVMLNRDMMGNMLAFEHEARQIVNG